MPVILITGANRGIGLDFAKRYASQKDTVLCLVRDPSKMPKIDGDIHVVKYSADSRTGAKEAVEALQSKGIKHVDVAIANAAINPVKDSFAELDPDVFEHTFRTNVTSVMLLLRDLKPLLTPSPGSPYPKAQFIAISSGAGTINKEMKPGQGNYGLSKAALNFLVRKLHFEHPELVVYAFSPGWLATDMGRTGAEWSGLEGGIPPDDIEVCIPSMMKVIETCDKDKKLGGWMNNWDGARMEF